MCSCHDLPLQCDQPPQVTTIAMEHAATGHCTDVMNKVLEENHLSINTMKGTLPQSGDQYLVPVPCHLLQLLLWP
jgi:hypothetical protein